MGMFFENYHIKMSDGASQEKIKKAIESAFAKQGYVSCDDESATKSLVLRTSETGKWASMIFAEENEGEVDREFCSNVFLKLVEQMDAYGLIVNCVDSDFAMLRLVSIDEDIDSAITIGDSYTDEVTEKEALRDWESVVDTEKLYEVCCRDYTFAEEGLEKAAELLGFDKNQVFLTEDDTSDEGLTTLYFKKKNQRRKSFKTLFLEIFEEGLKDEGFVRVKGKYPYLARMVSEDVYQVITYKDEWCVETYQPQTRGCKAFIILSTFASLYNPFFSFSDPPKEQTGTLFKITSFKGFREADFTICDGKSDFIYNPESAESINLVLKDSLSKTQKWIIEKYESINNLNSCLRFKEFFSNMNQTLPIYDVEHKQWHDTSSEGCLYYIIDSFSNIEGYLKKLADDHKKTYHNNFSDQVIAKWIKKSQEIFLKKIKKRNAFFADTNTRRDFLTEMEERKKQKILELKELCIYK